MIASTLLLSADNYYVDANGNLPHRPEFDKKLLAALCKDQYVSLDGYKMLPPSIRDTAQLAKQEPTVGITIPEIDGLTDLLIVVRSFIPLGRGKKFRLDKFERIVQLSSLEIWRRK